MQRLLLALVLVFSASAANAQSLSRVDGSTDARASVMLEKPVFPGATHLGGSTTITQNASQDIVELTGIACPTPPNSWYRVFDLSQFSLPDGIDVTSVDIGIEEATAGTTTVNLYALNGAFTLANLTLRGTAALPISAANNLSIVNVPLTASFAANEVLVVEWAVPQAGVYFGGNAAGQDGPTYIRAAACGATEPADLAGLGFPDSHWVVNVTGTTAPITGPSLQVVPGSIAFGNVQTGATEMETITLTNNGDAQVTISSIVFAGSGSISVDQTGTDLTLDPGQSTTIMVTFAPMTAGPATGTITVTSNAPGSPLAIPVTGTGFIGDDTNPAEFPSTDTPIAITDSDPVGISSTIVIPGTETGSITDLNVDLDITHTWVGDVAITLTRGAQVVSISDRPGVPEGTFGCSGGDIVVIVDDEGQDGSLADDCQNADPAYTTGGRYTPDTPLSVFDGTPAAGSYTLNVSDNAGGDTGTLNSWALLISGLMPDAGEGSPSAAARLAVAPNPVVGQGQVSLTVATTGDVRVALYDALGREVQVLLDRAVTAGQQAFIGFTTQGLPAGVYVVRATGADMDLVQRVTVVR